MAVFSRLFHKKDKEKKGRRLEIIAITGPDPVQAVKDPDDFWYKASVYLTAWRLAPANNPVHEEVLRLSQETDAEGLAYLRTVLKKDSVVRMTVREIAGGFELLEIGDGFCSDAEMNEICEGQKKPIVYRDERLGTLELNRATGMFSRLVGTKGAEYRLSIRKADQKHITHEADIAAEFIEKNEKWMEQATNYAADLLLTGGTVSGYRLDGEKITREEILQGLWLDSIDIFPDASFRFIFSDNNLFEGRRIYVDGNGHGRFTGAGLTR